MVYIFSLPENTNRSSLQVQFSTTPIAAVEHGRVLGVFYSRCLTDNIQIETPFSKNLLRLDQGDTKALATYSITPITAQQGDWLGRTVLLYNQLSFTLIPIPTIKILKKSIDVESTARCVEAAPQTKTMLCNKHRQWHHNCQNSD